MRTRVGMSLLMGLSLGCEPVVKLELARNSTAGKMRFTTSEFFSAEGAETP